MIRLGFIVPTAYLEEFASKSDFHLILPHVCEESEQYKTFYKQRAQQKDFVMLDNSIFELEYAYEGDKFIDLALETGVSEVVVPEVLRNRKESLKKTEKFLTLIHSRFPLFFPFRLAATVQGETFDEMAEHIKELYKIKEINTICIPFDLDYESLYMCFYSKTLRRVVNRINFVAWMREMGYVEKEVHLLGLSDGVELQVYKEEKYPFIRSNDSSSAFVHGYYCLKYTVKGLPVEKIEKKLDFSLKGPLSCLQRECIEHNISMLKAFVNGFYLTKE